jgi:hypothetical protein
VGGVRERFMGILIVFQKGLSDIFAQFSQRTVVFYQKA